MLTRFPILTALFATPRTRELGKPCGQCDAFRMERQAAKLSIHAEECGDVGYPGSAFKVDAGRILAGSESAQATVLGHHSSAIQDAFR